MAEYRDIVVIGAGIAGMTAAIYAARAGKSVQVLDERQRGIQPLCERGLALIRAADK